MICDRRIAERVKGKVCKMVVRRFVDGGNEYVGRTPQVDKETKREARLR